MYTFRSALSATYVFAVAAAAACFPVTQITIAISRATAAIWAVLDRWLFAPLAKLWQPTWRDMIRDFPPERLHPMNKTFVVRRDAPVTFGNWRACPSV